MPISIDGSITILTVLYAFTEKDSSIRLSQYTNNLRILRNYYMFVYFVLIAVVKMNVAIKMAIAGHEYELLNEMEMMESLKHPHILKMLDVTFDPLQLILEYCPTGDMNNWLKNQADPLSTEQRLKFMIGVHTCIIYYMYQ